MTAGRTTAPVVRRLTLLGLAAVGTIGAGILVVTPDGNGFLQPLDTAVHRAARSIGWSSGRSSVLTLSLALPAIAALLATIWFGASRANRDTLAPLAALGLALAVTAPIALLVRRPIPGDVGVLRAAAADRSFPSVAAAMTTALALTVAARSGGTEVRRQAFAIGAVAIALTSAIRVVSGTTWFLDEVVGIALGFLVANVVTPLLPAHTRRHPRRALVAGAAAVAAVALLVPIGSSYAGYLRAPGNVNGSERTIEFLRDHGLGPVVDRAESWWLWSHLPPSHGTIYALPAPPMSVPAGVQAGGRSAGPASTTLPPPSIGPASTTVPPPSIGPASTTLPPPSIEPAPTTSTGPTVPAADTGVPTPIAVPLSPRLPNEGVWTVAARNAAGHVEIATTTFRPDPAHPTLVAAVALLDHATTRLQMIAGLRQPGGGAGPEGGQIPPSLRPVVLAAFNSGYKMKDTPGGAYVDGRMARTMQTGVATLAISPNGTADVGAWGTDLDPAVPYLALRQNLHLAVWDGRVVDGLATNAGGLWGTVRNTLPTWRSAVGVTRQGDLLYVAGNQLTLGVLGDILVRAGAWRAMELDIHKGMVTFNLFSHRPQLAGHKLLPNMTTPANRYLSPDWRDFFVVTPA